MPAYEPVCDLAQGGMATVSLVVRREGSFLRPYAMKRFHHRSAGDPEIKQMFLDEARIAGLLRHPNVVSVLDVGEDETGPFLIMDYVEGLSLAELIRARQVAAGEPVPAQIGLRILVQAARGLAAAHELTSPTGAHLELVHRDISPQNILIDLGGTVRVADFGIARAAGRATETERGVLKGKLGYLAPETLQFADSDHRVDLFALGIVAFELFTGRRLYKGADVNETAKRILYEAPPDLGMMRPDIPDGVVELVFRLLAKEPELRPASAREAADAFDHLLVDLVSSEGPMPLDDFVRDLANVELIEARRAKIAAAMDGPETATRAAPAADARPRWLVPVGVAAAAAILAGIALAVGLSWSAESPPDPVVAQPPDGEADPDRATPATSAGADDDTPPASDPAPSLSDPEETAAATTPAASASTEGAPPDGDRAPDADAPRASRRAGRSRRRRSRPPSKTVPVVHVY